MKYLLTTFILSSLVMLAGCASTQVPGDTTNTTTTESAEMNANTNGVGTTLELSEGNVNTSAEGGSASGGNADSDVEADEVDTSDWLTYSNEEYGFSFKYPGDWILTENGRNISLRSQIIKTKAYTNSFSLIITDKDFETLQNEIEQSDIVNQNISLAKFNDDMAQKNINGVVATTGTHATALGPVKTYYYIPSNGFSIYIEFFEPTGEINTLVQPVISTLQIK